MCFDRFTCNSKDYYLKLKELKLKDLTLHKEHHLSNTLGDDYDSYYLSAVYERENKFIVSEITIPHIDLPLNYITGLDVTNHGDSIMDTPIYTLHMPGGYTLPVSSKDGDYCYKEKLVKEKRQKMTMEEVEAALGYKIELVSEK